ncbi:MAG: DUF4968 domain-containing protein, partial [Pseudobacter sp.]|uniref:DUF4968 domain-containing protein n=1 Tax=Pseudobacter sp. TaxID=2045420 RepID=UPI003F80AB8E
MMQRIFVCLVLVSMSFVAQAQWKTPGTINSYTVNGNNVVFHGEQNAKVQIGFCSPSVLKIWFAPDGAFTRNNESFAVINESLEPVGTIHVNDEPQAYEIFTSKLRVRVNKSPFRLQVFDKWQKLLL